MQRESFIVKRGNNNFNNFTGLKLEPASAELTLDDTGVVKDPPILPDVLGGITFQDPKTMNCQQLVAAIEQYKETLTAPSLVALDPTFIASYYKAISDAQSVFNKKCIVEPGPKPPDPVPINGPIKTNPIKTNSIPGGAVSHPAAPTIPPKTGMAVAKKIPWLWIIVGAGIIYYVVSSSKGAKPVSSS